MAPRARAKKSKPSPHPTAATPSRVAEGLYVGGWSDATGFAGTRICVLDAREDDAPADHQIPIYDGALKAALVSNLDRIAELADQARAKGDDVLMFCGHGVRRGPLAMAWYLRRHDGGTIDDAYARIEAVRPQVERASRWIRNWNDPGRTVASPSSVAGRARRPGQ